MGKYFNNNQLMCTLNKRLNNYNIRFLILKRIIPYLEKIESINNLGNYAIIE